MKSRKVLSILMIISLLLSLFSLSSFTAGALTDGDFVFEMYDEESVIITGYKKNGAESLTIPSTLGGYPVKAIGTDAFSDKAIYKIKLPDTLEVIEDFAFWNTAITYILIPQKVSHIGVGAFSGGRFERYVVDHNSTFRVYNGLLYNISVTELISLPTMAPFNISPDTREIAPYACLSAQNLKDIRLSSSTDKVGEGAFMYSSVEIVSIPSADHIDDLAFFGCENLTDVIISSSTEYISPNAFDESAWLKNQPEGMITFSSGSIAYKYKGIAPETFELAKNTYRVCAKAFAGQPNLKEIIVPPYTRYIDFSAFDMCSSLENFVIKENNNHFKSKNGMLYSHDEKILHVCPAGKSGEVTIPDGTVRVDAYAFEYCEKVTRVIIPYSVRTLGAFSFINCTALKEITVPKGVVTLGEYALGYNYSYDSETGELGYAPMEDFLIKSYNFTTTQKYARAHNFEFVSLDDVPVSDITGDADGDFKLSVRDATAIQKYVANIIGFDENQRKVADFNLDGNINVRDATAIQKKLAGLTY